MLAISFNLYLRENMNSRVVADVRSKKSGYIWHPAPPDISSESELRRARMPLISTAIRQSEIFLMTQNWDGRIQSV